MWLEDELGARQRLFELLGREAPRQTGNLDHIVQSALARRDAILALAARHSTPFYAFDRAGFAEKLREYTRLFGAALPGHRAFYAMKSNHHPLVVAEAVRQGYGLDVSSGRELTRALAFPDCEIVFSGPAKSEADLALALTHAERVTVQLDSFGELERLGRLVQQRGRSIRAGVRVTTDHHGAWSKFGIPLADLARFWREAAQWPGVALVGIQSHLSWNRNPLPYVRVIDALAASLERDFTPEQRGQIAFVDLGGGFRPHQIEGSFPGDEALGSILRTANDEAGVETRFRDPWLVKESVPLQDYASAIAAAFDQRLRPLCQGAVVYTEPGRILSTYAFDLVLRVVDKKSQDLVLVDGGIHMVGWEKYLHIYCPVVNLTRPDCRELQVRIGGSLCDCEDIWGMRCHASAIEVGDVLVVPFQGAYTWCVAQSFIRDIPPVHELCACESAPAAPDMDAGRAQC